MELSSYKSSCIHEQYTSRAVRGPKSKGVKNRVQQRWHTSFLTSSPRMEVSRFNSPCDVTRAKGGPPTVSPPTRADSQPHEARLAAAREHKYRAGSRRDVHSHPPADPMTRAPVKRTSSDRRGERGD